MEPCKSKQQRPKSHPESARMDVLEAQLLSVQDVAEDLRCGDTPKLSWITFLTGWDEPCVGGMYQHSSIHPSLSTFASPFHPLILLRIMQLPASL